MISPREYTCAKEDNEIYGEINVLDFIRLIKECPFSIYRILDVGSGCGRCLISLCKSKLGDTIEYVCGIESNTYRYNKSVNALSSESESILNKVEFICDDLSTISFVHFDLVYCCNTMFDSNLNVTLVDKLLQEKVGIFMLYTIEPRCRQFYWKTVEIETSWLKKVPVYIYHRLND